MLLSVLNHLTMLQTALLASGHADLVTCEQSL